MRVTGHYLATLDSNGYGFRFDGQLRHFHHDIGQLFQRQFPLQNGFQQPESDRLLLRVHQSLLGISEQHTQLVLVDRVTGDVAH